MKRKTEKTEKFAGRVFTPPHLVEFMLDLARYVPNGSILGKHVIDNSCGDGAFLESIVRRYVEAFKRHRGSQTGVERDLERFVHGIEVDETTFSNCIQRLDATAVSLGIGNVRWDIRNADALSEKAFDGRMDWVVGNPPYVRVHNLGASTLDVKRRVFSQGGMTDLFLSFYELGFKMLSPKGLLCYVTPSSWLNSLAGTNMRAYVRMKRTLAELVDLGHYQPFEATAYVAVALFENGTTHDAVRFGTYGEEQCETFVDRVPLEEAWFEDSFRFAKRHRLQWLKSMLADSSPRRVVAKNGFATLADDVFIADAFPFDEFVIPVVKASTGQWRKAFFPYDANGKPLPRDLVFRNSAVAKWLEANKHLLLKGKPEDAYPDWHLFGRTQALLDVFSEKWAVNSCVKNPESVKIVRAPVGSGVYGGLYVLGDTSSEELRAALCGDEFFE